MKIKHTKMNFYKITPLFIVLAIIELFLIFFTIYFLLINNNNGNAMGGTIGLIGALLNIIIIFIERFIANLKVINMKLLWVIEIVIIIIATIYILKNGISIG
jgi:glucan phosphoethanolaminetransferase (alkaline phosphatase superfamily)